MPGAANKFYFAEKIPVVFVVVFSLLFANTFSMLLLEFGHTYLFPKHVSSDCPLV
jgi:hypothetical protein